MFMDMNYQVRVKELVQIKNIQMYEKIQVHGLESTFLEKETREQHKYSNLCACLTRDCVVDSTYIILTTELQQNWF